MGLEISHSVYTKAQDGSLARRFFKFVVVIPDVLVAEATELRATYSNATFTRIKSARGLPENTAYLVFNIFLRVIYVST